MIFLLSVGAIFAFALGPFGLTGPNLGAEPSVLLPFLEQFLNGGGDAVAVLRVIVLKALQLLDQFTQGRASIAVEISHNRSYFSPFSAGTEIRPRILVTFLTSVVDISLEPFHRRK